MEIIRWFSITVGAHLSFVCKTVFPGKSYNIFWKAQ